MAAAWKQAAIEKAGVISDCWDVILAYGGHAARWILFVCMCIQIVQVLPGVHMWDLVQSIVLGTQVITLDIAGFSLSSLAKAARQAGEEEVASKAKKTATALIGIMMATVFLATVGMLYPPAQTYTALAENGLILVRVLMVVIYNHVIHEVRDAVGVAPVISTSTVNTPQAPAIEDIVAEVLRQIREAQPANTTTAAATEPTEPQETTNTVETASEPKPAPESEKEEATAETPHNTTDESASASDMTDESEKSDIRHASTRERILDYATCHPEATQQQIADACGVSLRTVQRHLSQPKETPQKLQLVR